MSVLDLNKLIDVIDCADGTLSGEKKKKKLTVLLHFFKLIRFFCLHVVLKLVIA